ncbi:retrovirus-related pol polyprotein from transposon TNT 1-94 [Tanacetum coccineum]
MRGFGNEYSQKDKNKGKTDKTEHGIEKSVENQSRRQWQDEKALDCYRSQSDKGFVDACAYFSMQLSDVSCCFGKIAAVVAWSTMWCHFGKIAAHFSMCDECFRIVRTDNGIEFTNQQLKAYFEDVRIAHQTSMVRTPP